MASGLLQVVRADGSWMLPGGTASRCCSQPPYLVHVMQERDQLSLRSVDASKRDSPPVQTHSS